MGTQDVVTSNSSPTGVGMFLVGVGLRMRRTEPELVICLIYSARIEGKCRNTSQYFFVIPGEDPSGQGGFGRALTTEAAQPQAPVPAARFCNHLFWKKLNKYKFSGYH